MSFCLLGDFELKNGDVYSVGYRGTELVYQRELLA